MELKDLQSHPFNPDLKPSLQALAEFIHDCLAPEAVSMLWLEGDFAIRRFDHQESVMGDTVAKIRILETQTFTPDDENGCYWIVSKNPASGTSGLIAIRIAPSHRNEKLIHKILKNTLHLFSDLMEKQSDHSAYEQLKEEHEQITQALRDSEAFYLSLVETLPQNIFRKNLAEQFTFVNGNFCQTLGTKPEDILGKTDFDFFPKELAQKYQRDDQRVISTGVPIDTVEAHLTHDGDRIFVHVMKTPARDADGHIIGIQGIFWDVTERKRTEEALAYERSLLTALLSNAPDAIYFKDIESRFIKCSNALARRFGTEDVNSLVGKTDADFFSPEHAQRALQDERRIITTGEPSIGITEKETWRDGTESWVLSSKLPLRKEDGTIVGTFGISKDISMLKNAEEQLARARDLALESTRLKSEFLANVSHEIRTPMNGIIGMTDMILDTELSEQQDYLAGTIRKCANQLMSILDDVLDFSKIEAGKLQLESTDLDIRETVEETVELLAESAHQKNLEIGSLVRNEIPDLVLGDPVRLRQVLTNLLGNAIKFTDRGNVSVVVSLEEETRASCVLRFDVKDTGIGLAPEVRRRIFKAFSQADGSTTRRYGGTGLGLAISRELVKLMRGRIGVESTLNEGSNFWFTIKLKKNPNKNQPADHDLSTTLRDVRVLIVDDNKINLTILEAQTRSVGMEPTTISNPHDAIPMLEQNLAFKTPFDIAILDMQMPELDGIRLAQSIAQHPTLSLPVILLTSLGNLPSESKHATSGISATLIKPVKQRRLLTTLYHLTADQPEPLNDLANTRSIEKPIDLVTGLTVLVGEDNPVNLAVALRQLRKLGVTGIGAANGTEVLEQLAKDDKSIILMDCQMPIMDGFEATRRIRADEKANPEIEPRYIIAMTANALRGDRERCLDAGMNDYLSKPVDLSRLSQALQRAAASVGIEGATPVAPTPNRGEDYEEPFGSVDRASQSSDQPTVDLALLDGLRGLREGPDDDPLRELIDLFLGDTPKRLESIIQGVKECDLAKAATAAHSLKGSANNIGARPLAALCAGIEKTAKNAKTVPQPAIEALIKESHRVKTILEHERTK